MRRLLVVVLPSVVCVATFLGSLASCGKDDPPATVPSNFDTGFPIFDAPVDTAKPGTDTEPVDSGAPDTTIVDSGTTADADATFSDITSTKDTNIGDVTKLMEGGPPDVPPDTDLPDALDVDTGPLDTMRPTD